MSDPNIIESIARGAKSGITGAVAPADTARAQDRRGADMVRNMVLGGLSLGAGTSAIVALINYLRSMRKEDELSDVSRMNDDTLYIPAPVKSAAEGDQGVNRWLAPGLAVTGGILSAGGSYALTQMVYNYMQRKRREKMLDEAQGEALAMADEEAMKSAASTDAKMDLYDLITAFPVAVPLLAALAAGGVSYAALNKTFPTVKKPKSKFPRRIRQVAQTGNDDVEVDEADTVEKMARLAVADDDCEAAAREFLMLTVAQMSHEKSAEHRLTSDILHKAAKDGIGMLLQVQEDGGIPALIEFVKGASSEQVDLPNRALAAATICKSARLSPLVTTLAAAELQELSPVMYAHTVSHGEERLEKYAGLAALLQLAFFRPTILHKSAAEDNAALLDQLAGMLHGDTGLSEDAEESLTSDQAGSAAEEAEGNADTTDEINTDASDPVDQFMGQSGSSSPLLAPDNEEEDEAVRVTRSM